MYQLQVINHSNVSAFIRSPLFLQMCTQLEHCFGGPNDGRKKRREVLNSVQPASREFTEYYLLCNDKGDVLIASCLAVHKIIHNTCEIHSVCVNPEFRGQGVCKVLMEKVRNYLIDSRGTLSIHIYCKTKNQSACKCYRHVFGPPVHVTQKTQAYAILRTTNHDHPVDPIDVLLHDDRV